MSRKLIKNLQDDEMNCYVCRKQIESLAKLRDIYKHKTIEFSYTPSEIKIIREFVNEKVVPVGTGEQKLFRHSECDPTKFSLSVEDL